MLQQKLISQVRQKVRRTGQALSLTAGGIFTFLLTNIRILNRLSPFGAAFAMALPGNFSLSAIAGGIAGCTLLGNFERNIPYLIAFLGILAFKLGVAGHPRLRSSRTVLCLSSFAILAVSLEIGTILNGEGLAGFLLKLAESALGGAMTCFSLHAVRGAEDLSAGKEPSAIRKASLSILLLTVLCGLTGIPVHIFNPGRILSVFLTLWITGRCGMTAGAVAGLSAGTALTLARTEYALTGAILAVSGMIGGIFSKFGRITVSAMFLGTAAAAFLITGMDAPAVTAGFDILLGTAFFLILPDRMYRKLQDFRALPNVPLSPENGRISAQLSFASQTVQEIRESVDAVSQRLNRASGSGVQDVYDRTCGKVCRRCGLKMFCWETAFSQTREAFRHFTPILREKGAVSPEELPSFFQTKCPKKEELLQNLNKFYHEYLSRENAGRKVLGAKQVALEQLDGVAELLEDIGRDLSEGEACDRESEDKVKAFLEEIGAESEEVYCVIDRYGRIRVEIYHTRSLPMAREELAETLSEMLERPFDLPCTVQAGTMVRTSFFERAAYTLDFYASQKNAGDAAVCGDSYEYFADPRGYAHIILSDGMGSGSRAAIDSIMTCNFVLKLIKAGFRFDASLRFINSALLVKAGDESLATLDISCIDLYTGTAEFLKAGGASSFLCRDGQAAAVQGRSLPIGILQGVEYDRHKIDLREGDLIIMATDGAIPISDEWMTEEIAMVSDQSPRIIAERLAEAARHRQQGRGDDITVIAARLVSAEPPKTSC